MIFRDLLAISLGNLWRMKLRASLTIAGVVIAIAAFVAMLSFGAGMQENVAAQFDKLGLFSTMLVYPQRAENQTDTVETRPLNDSAVALLARIPGVRLAYPFNDFNVTVRIDDTTLNSRAQALPIAALETKVFSQFKAGSTITSDSAKEALVTTEFAEMLEMDDPDSLLGKQIVISVYASNLDSGLTHVFAGAPQEIRNRLEEIKYDSLINVDYIRRVARRELGLAVQRFADGYFNAREKISDTLTIKGVLEGERGHRLWSQPIIVPAVTARKLSSGGFSGDPADLLDAVKGGSLSLFKEDITSKNYNKVTLDLDPAKPYEPIKDSVTALGFRTFSYAEQFKEIKKSFMYFNMILGIIGFIAMLTASLGIVNTMIMSIIERKREIGVLKSLGADDSDIRLLFLVESGAIGAIGAIIGIIFGWLITRLTSAIVKIIMERQGVDSMELFSLPLWLILLAFAFAVIVSLLAGYYPSARASRVDPVSALRND